MNELMTVPFHQQSIFAVEKDGKRWVAMKPMVEAIGLQADAQIKRLKRDPVLSTCTSIMDVQIPGDDQVREVTFLDLDYLNGWLFGISANAVKPELRDRVIEYQRECYKVLSGHFSAQEQRAHQKELEKFQQAERAYFGRYPIRRRIRDMAMQCEPYFYIAHSVGCATGTVGRAIKDMIKWGMMNSKALEIARIGVIHMCRYRRKYINQLSFNF